MTSVTDMPIGQLAALTGESVKALRYWTDFGLLSVERRSSGYRHYPPQWNEPTRPDQAARHFASVSP